MITRSGVRGDSHEGHGGGAQGGGGPEEGGGGGGSLIGGGWWEGRAVTGSRQRGGGDDSSGDESFGILVRSGGGNGGGDEDDSSSSSSSSGGGSSSSSGGRLIWPDEDSSDDEDYSVESDGLDVDLEYESDDSGVGLAAEADGAAVAGGGDGDGDDGEPGRPIVEPHARRPRFPHVVGGLIIIAILLAYCVVPYVTFKGPDTSPTLDPDLKGGACPTLGEDVGGEARPEDPETVPGDEDAVATNDLPLGKKGKKDKKKREWCMGKPLSKRMINLPDWRIINKRDRPPAPEWLQKPTRLSTEKTRRHIRGPGQKLVGLLMATGDLFDIQSVWDFKHSKLKHLKDFCKLTRARWMYALLKKVPGRCIRWKLIKIGITSDPSRRCNGYRDAKNPPKTGRPVYPDFDKNYRIYGIFPFDLMSLATDHKVAEYLRRALLAIKGDPEAPTVLKSFITRFFPVSEGGRGYHAGGPKAQLMLGYVECRVQSLLYGLPSPCEQFGSDEDMYERLTEYAEEGANQLIAWKDQYTPEAGFDEAGGEAVYSEENVGESGVHIHGIGTWATGAHKDVLSSAVTGMEYIAGPGRYQDTIEEPLYPNAKTAEEIFARDFTPKQRDDADESACTQGRDHLRIGREQRRPTLIIFDDQNYLYGDLREPQHIVRTAWEMKLAGSTMDDELILYHNNKGDFALIIGHTATAGDSRKPTKRTPSEARKLQRAAALDAVRHFRRNFEGSLGEDGAFETYAITGAMVANYLNYGLHGNPKFAAAVYRDYITPDSINAVSKFRGAKTVDDWKYPAGEQNRMIKNRPDIFDYGQVINEISHVPEEDMYEWLDDLRAYIKTKYQPTKKWETLVYGKLAPATGAEDDDLVPLIEKWADDRGHHLTAESTKVSAATKKEEAKRLALLRDSNPNAKFFFFKSKEAVEAAAELSDDETRSKHLKKVQQGLPFAPKGPVWKYPLFRLTKKDFIALKREWRSGHGEMPELRGFNTKALYSKTDLGPLHGKLGELHVHTFKPEAEKAKPKAKSCKEDSEDDDEEEG